MSRIRVERITNKEGTGAPLFPNGIRVVGLTSLSNVVAGVTTFTSDVSIGGTLTYEDVTNIDSVGLITARSGLKVTAGGVDVTAGGIDVAAGQFKSSGDSSTAAPPISSKDDTNTGINFPGADALGLVAGGSRKLLVNSVGVTINNGSLDVNGGDVLIADKIVHKDNTNTSIRFPSANTFAIETGNSERLRIGSAGQIGIAGANYGTSGQVLTSGGGSAAPSWADAGGGAWALLQSASNPNTSTVDFVGLTTAYAAYKVHFINASINTSNVREMRCRIYLNGSLKTGSEYQQLTTYMSVGSNSQGGYGGTTSAILLSGAGNGARGYNGELTFPMKLRTSGAIDSMQAFYGTCISHDFHNTIGGFHNGSYSTLLTGIRFDSPDNYNVTDGQFYLYGLTRT